MVILPTLTFVREASCGFNCTGSFSTRVPVRGLFWRMVNFNCESITWWCLALQRSVSFLLRHRLGVAVKLFWNTNFKCQNLKLIIINLLFYLLVAPDTFTYFGTLTAIWSRWTRITLSLCQCRFNANANMH